MQETRMFLIDRSKLFREGIKRLLVETPFHVCGEASTVEDGIRQLGKGGGVELILLDYPGDVRKAVEALQSLRRIEPKCKLVILTAEMGREQLMAALSAGAEGYLLKDMSSDALVQSLRLIVLGEKVLPTDLATLLVNGGFSLENELKAAPPAKNLSMREVQILTCLLRGDSNKRIANQLNITEGTVKVHLKGVLKKINVRNRTQAAIWALNYGLGQDRSERRSQRA